MNSCDASARPLEWMTAARSFVTEVLVDELLGGSLDEALRSAAVWYVVEHDHVQPPLEAARVRFDVGRRPPCCTRAAARRPLDRDVHLRENVDLLRLAVLEDLEILARQALDDVALVVGDDGVHLDVVDLDPEGDGRLARCGAVAGCGGRARRRGPAGTAAGAPGDGRGKGGSEQGGEESSSHGRATGRGTRRQLFRHRARQGRWHTQARNSTSLYGGPWPAASQPQPALARPDCYTDAL